MYFTFNIKYKPIIEVNCENIHEGLIDMGEVVCFMCHDQIAKIDTSCNKNLCNNCDMLLIDDNGLKVCENCGHVEESSYKQTRDSILDS